MELRDDRTSVKQAVKDKGVLYYALSNAIQILPEACKRLKPNKTIIKSIEKEFKRYGIEELVLK